MKFRTLDHKKGLCFFDLGNLFAVTKKTSGSPFGLPSVVLDPQKRAPLGGFGPTKKVPRSKKQAFFMVSVRNYYSSRIYTFYPQFFSFSTQGPLIFDIWAPGFLFSIRPFLIVAEKLIQNRFFWLLFYLTHSLPIQKQTSKKIFEFYFLDREFHLKNRPLFRMEQMLPKSLNRL
jgi:hypothetical protein